MKKIFVLGIAIAVMLLSGAAGAEIQRIKFAMPRLVGVIVAPDIGLTTGAPFSADKDDYTLYALEEGSKFRFVFYGKLTEAVSDEDLVTTKLYWLWANRDESGNVTEAVDINGDKAEMEFEIERCENFPKAGENAFRCICAAMDPLEEGVESVEQQAFIFHPDQAYIQFRMNAKMSAYIEGRGFWADASFGTGKSDSDKDGVPDEWDNCKTEPNMLQEDVDGDGTGDACDQCEGEDSGKDSDHDGVDDACDPCPYQPNTDECQGGGGDGSKNNGDPVGGDSGGNSGNGGGDADFNSPLDGADGVRRGQPDRLRPHIRGAVAPGSKAL
jgi:hypothetical protein